MNRALGVPYPHFFTANKIYNCLLEKPELLDRPLYLIGHSLGGLLIKQLIRTAESEAFMRGSRAKQFLKQLKKIVFLYDPSPRQPDYRAPPRAGRHAGGKACYDDRGHFVGADNADCQPDLNQSPLPGTGDWKEPE